MFSLFPSDWENPRPKHWFSSSKKPIKNLADHHFPQQPITVKISRPVPSSVPKPSPAQSVPKPVVNTIPPCEMLRPDEEIDTTEIDMLLAELETPCPESRAERILQMIKTVNQQIQNAIIIIQNVSPYEDDRISRKEILRLLQMFSNYSKTIEQYIKEKQPSSF